MVSILWLDHDCSALLVYFWLMSACSSQMDLPVNVCDTFYSLCSWCTHCSDNVSPFLFPIQCYCLFSLLSRRDLPRQILIELVFVHIQTDNLTDQTHCVVHQMVELVALNRGLGEKVRVKVLQVDIWLVSNFMSLGLLDFLQLIFELDLSQTFQEC